MARKYTDTENLIATVKQIDPELYKSVCKVVNADGTLTHVYVRCSYRTDEEHIYFLNKHFNAMAYASVRTSDTYEKACYSQIGVPSVFTGFLLPRNFKCESHLVLILNGQKND